MSTENQTPGAEGTRPEARVCPETSPIAALKASLLDDREYHLGWHCNLACAAMDSFADLGLPFETRWHRSQETARRFVDVLFAGDDHRPSPITNDEVRVPTQAIASNA